jgi:hypothetical protein
MHYFNGRKRERDEGKEEIKERKTRVKKEHENKITC